MTPVPSNEGAAPAAAEPTKHRIRWYARLDPCPEAPDGWLPRTAAMRGSWGWDVRCLSCQRETRTGGGTERYLRELVWLHKSGYQGGSWHPMGPQP
jgi:hypothetical protein